MFVPKRSMRCLGIALALSLVGAEAYASPVPEWALIVSHGAGDRLVTMAQAMNQWAVKTAYEAGQAQNTGVQTSGTVSFDADGSAIGFDAEPSDHLVAEFASGHILHFDITTLQGDTSRGDESFFSSMSFSIAYRVWDEDLFTDVEIQLSSRWGQGEGAMRGHVALAGEPLEIDVSNTHRYRLSLGSGTHGMELTLNGTASNDDMLIELSQEADISLGKTSGGQGRIVIKSEPDHALTVDSHTYRWRNVSFQQIFVDGQPAELSSWYARGDITRMSRTFLSYAFHNISDNNLSCARIVLEADGMELPVQAWSLEDGGDHNTCLAYYGLPVMPEVSVWDLWLQ